MAKEDSTAQFAERARSVQTVVAEAKDLAAVFEYAADITVKQGGDTLAAPGIQGKERDRLLEVCRAKGIELICGELRETAGRISTGLTGADWGIAQTGTLVMDSKSEDIRLASMLCETHVAFIKKSRIAPDAGTIEKELSKMMKASHGYLAFISGASRTADIERVLTIGVHGPRELHVLIIGEDGQ
ncbi:MAG: lactate utilization protein [Syntrophobacteraceae bacterium]|nr:lactate utilization protein [Syntrophobacteraceae bacterium]